MPARVAGYRAGSRPLYRSVRYVSNDSGLGSWAGGLSKSFMTSRIAPLAPVSTLAVDEIPAEHHVPVVAILLPGPAGSPKPFPESADLGGSAR